MREKPLVRTQTAGLSHIVTETRFDIKEATKQPFSDRMGRLSLHACQPKSAMRFKRLRSLSLALFLIDVCSM